jgi:Protein of unknown function (DUF2934)
MIFPGERPGGGIGGDEGAPETTWSAAMTNRERRIREIAYHLWEQEGRPEGESHSHRLWLAAEAQFEAENTERKDAGNAPAAEAFVEPPAEPAVKADEPAVKAAEPAIKAAEPAVKAAEPAIKAAEPAVEKPALHAKQKTDEPAAEKAARSAKSKAAEPAPEKKTGSARAKVAEPAAEKPAGSGKRKPGAK